MNFGATFPIVIGLFIAMVICLEAGYRLASRRIRIQGNVHDGLGSIEAAVFAMLGLLLGFAFSQALARFDARRHMIIDEANAISTAYMRLDFAPVDDQTRLRQLFRDYLDARIHVYATLDDDAAMTASISAAEAMQRRIWTAIVESSKHDSTQSVTRVLVPAVNEMIDITTVRTVYLRVGIPRLILALLMVVALCSAMNAGYAMAKRGHRSILHVLLYATSIAMTIYVVLDLEQPRRGVIRLTETDRILESLRKSME